MSIRYWILFFTATLLTVQNLNAQVTDNASTSHVFAQFADGKFPDGYGYQSTLMVSSDNGAAVSCLLTMFGMTVPGVGNGSEFQFNVAPGSWAILKTPGTQEFKKGYAAVDCTAPVTAQVLYTFLSPFGQVLSEATVFSSPPATYAQLLADQRNGANLGIAIANDSDSEKDFLIEVVNAEFESVGSTTIRLAARSQEAKFLNEMIPSVPVNFVGQVFIYTDTSQILDVFAIGLRFTGLAFTTIPVTLRNF